MFHPTLIKWRESQGQGLSQGKTIPAKYLLPLLYEPGTSWSYGASTDWAGRVVERVTGLSLESYMTTHIWEPLGIRDMTFHLERREDLRNRMLGMSFREAFSGKAVFTGAKSWDDPVEDDFGGAGVYSSMPDYLKVLQAVLSADRKLLGAETWEEMFRPQLSPAARESMMEQLTDPEVNDRLGNLPLGSEKDWGLGGMLLQEDIKDGRRKGTLLWGGVPNLFWVSLLLRLPKPLCLLDLRLMFPSGSIVRLVCVDYMELKCFLLETLGQYEPFSSSNEPCMSGSTNATLDSSSSPRLTISNSRHRFSQNENMFAEMMVSSFQIRRRVPRSVYCIEDSCLVCYRKVLLWIDQWSPSRGLAGD